MSDNTVTFTAPMHQTIRILKLAEIGARTLDAIDEVGTVTLPGDLNSIEAFRNGVQEAWLAQ